MTNGEKYKTAKERQKAFDRFCELGGGYHDCENCKLRKEEEFTACVLAWLDLEAEEEKPMPCPFCGYGTDIEYTSLDCDTDEWYGVRCLSCEYVSKNYHLLEEAIAAHNRVCKAVAAYKESEVK